MSATLDTLFDLDAMILEADRANAPAWTGAPLRYHEEPRTPEELDDAFDRWIFEHGRAGCYPDSHMWHRYPWGPQAMPRVRGHQLTVYAASVSCRGRDHDHQDEPLPAGNERFQAICAPCGWRLISEELDTVIETMHDHAFPGWRDLPVVPRKCTGIPPRGRDPLREWVEANYPAHWQQPGHPIITERGGIGTRHVPDRSPWGGYDLSDHCL